MNPDATPPAESAPADTLPSPDQTSAEDLRVGGTLTVAYATSGQRANGSGLALGGAGYGSPILGFWGLTADATYWPADFDFGRLGIDLHVAGRAELWNVDDRRVLTLPGDLATGIVVRRGAGEFTYGFGAGARLLTLPVVGYTDVTLAEARPRLAPLFGLTGSGLVWWEPTAGPLAGGHVRADARVTLGTALGAHAGVLVDKPVGLYPWLLRVGLAADLDLGFRLGSDPARVLRGAITGSVGLARVF